MKRIVSIILAAIAFGAPSFAPAAAQSPATAPTPAETPVYPTGKGKLPEGFRPLFDGRTLKGWHASRANHHGSDPDARVVNGELQLRQNPIYQGGIWLTDDKYLDFEFYAEFLSCIGCDTGFFFRSTEGGNTYQVNIDNPQPTSSCCELLTEFRPGIGARRDPAVPDPYRIGQWNALRVRFEGGDTPVITTWLNGVKLYESHQPKAQMWTDTEGGYIGVQLHFSGFYTMPKWTPDGVMRVRNIGIRTLP